MYSTGSIAFTKNLCLWINARLLLAVEGGDKIRDVLFHCDADIALEPSFLWFSYTFMMLLSILQSLLSKDSSAEEKNKNLDTDIDIRKIS